MNPVDLEALEAKHAEWREDIGQRGLRDVANYHKERTYGVALEFHNQAKWTVLRAAETIAALHNAFPALVAELRAARAERDRLLKIFDDAGQGEHNILALIDYYQDEALAAYAELRALREDVTKHCGTAPACRYRPAEVTHDGKAITVMNSADSHRLSAALEELYALREVAEAARPFVPPCNESVYYDSGVHNECGKPATHIDRMWGIPSDNVCAEHAARSFEAAKKAASKGNSLALERDTPVALEPRIVALSAALAKVPR